MEHTIDNSTSDFCRAAAWLIGGGIVVGLSLLPFAMARTGTGSPTGLLAAAVICVTAGLMSEVLRCFLLRATPLASLLLGMVLRVAPPLFVCLFLAARHENGWDHLAFVCYLLAFYGLTLALESWFAVQRAGQTAQVGSKLRINP
jgi:hypothetical protein